MSEKIKALVIPFGNNPESLNDQMSVDYARAFYPEIADCRQESNCFVYPFHTLLPDQASVLREYGASEMDVEYCIGRIWYGDFDGNEISEDYHGLKCAFQINQINKWTIEVHFWFVGVYDFADRPIGEV